MFVVKTANFNFTYDGPIFSKPIDFEIGEIVYRKYEKQRGFLKHGL
jgi:hypothetical protein